MFTCERSIHSLIPRSHSITWSAMEWGLGMRQLQHKLRVKSVCFLPIRQHKLPQYSFSFCSLLQLCGPALVSALPPSAFPPHHCWHPAHKSKKTQHNAVESTRPSTWQASLVPRLSPCEWTYCKRPKAGWDLVTRLITNELSVKAIHTSNSLVR